MQILKGKIISQSVFIDQPQNIHVRCLIVEQATSYGVLLF